MEKLQHIFTSSILNSRDPSQLTLQQRHACPLYQEVINKNYETIKMLMSKINELYIKNQECQSKIYQLDQKVSNLESNSTLIHSDLRTTYLDLNKRLNESSAYQNQFKSLLKKSVQQNAHDQYLKSHFFKIKSKLLEKKGNCHRSLRNIKIEKAICESDKIQNESHQNVDFFKTENIHYTAIPQICNLDETQEQHKQIQGQKNPSHQQLFLILAQTKKQIYQKIDGLESANQFLKQKQRSFMQKYNQIQTVDNLKLQIQRLKFEVINLKQSELHHSLQIKKIFQQNFKSLQEQVDKKLNQKANKIHVESSFTNLSRAIQQELTFLHSKIENKINQTLTQLQNETKKRLKHSKLISNNIQIPFQQTKLQKNKFEKKRVYKQILHFKSLDISFQNLTSQDNSRDRFLIKAKKQSPNRQCKQEVKSIKKSRYTALPLNYQYQKQNSISNKNFQYFQEWKSNALQALGAKNKGGRK